MRKFLSDLFTGSDGKTFAIGRVYSLPMLLVGLAIPVLQVFKGHAVSLVDLGAMFTGLGAGVMALVMGTHATEPKP